MKSSVALLSSIAWTRSSLIWVWILKWLAPGTISLMQHAETELYILSKGGVESALSNVRVESYEINTDDTNDAGATAPGFCVARQNEAESLQALLVGIVLSLEVLYNTLLRLLDKSADAETDTSIGTLVESSKLNLSKLSVRSKEHLLKHGYFSGCLAAALANILRKNPLGSPSATCLVRQSAIPLP